MKDKDKYFVETENLAFPEIHTGKVKQISSEKPNADKSVIYDTVAVPEIHIKKKKISTANNNKEPYINLCGSFCQSLNKI